MRHILPSPIVSISAVVRQLQPHLPPIDTLQALVTCEDGTTGSVSISFGLARPSEDKRYIFRGEKGIVEVDFGDKRTHVVKLVSMPSANAPASGQDAEERAQDSCGEEGQPEEPQKLEMEFPAQVGVENEFEAFGKVYDGAEVDTAEVLRRCGPRATLRDLAFIEAAIKSSEEKRQVSLRELIGDDLWDIGA